ncbi:hypothetical protein CcI156_07110 [Frankia sp. CcI156]|uniref:Uncharacterized protein n=1 Tax=Frankia casuarinae (strain DSM 45818 / CECT 9043 / HFP020203 / CcI3) TaxID=106370 RepID=Q2J643_FRACC|nr:MULTISPECIES: hypothetical protein [Frankia]ABD13249.1 conserved hypothetical protein [Frankia casuarinae]ETA03879.1 hypothetical protein CcI6DRAFT_00716 [Frankia sp. CcI6]EYT93770.1 hypothetical protein ThrDRAFT_00520 [Frankia casuarinae]KDA44414.1 hypothetical protein BMG523Draft_00588 [Frankia sp. BMG5.23]KEZ37217.1 hypothetical protein CEDDRAFT_01471 [Frankia sp. CeD]
MSGPRGRGYGRPGERAEVVPADDAAAWFAEHIPAGWFAGMPTVVVDRDEITVIGVLAAGGVAPGGGPSATGARIRRFREQTREERIAIATKAEHRYNRKVAWGATVGDTTELFTALSVPVMTRLRQPERQVLDTLVDSGVARSRSEALAWCVRLVGENADSWLRQLREAMEQVEKIRSVGPRL